MENSELSYLPSRSQNVLHPGFDTRGTREKFETWYEPKPDEYVTRFLPVTQTRRKIKPIFNSNTGVQINIEM
jgi:hypothetical protein